MPLTRLTDLPQEVAAALDVPGAIVIGVQEDGSIVIHSHGVESHKKAVELLSVGIHALLSQHDAQVLAGDAGPEAAERFKEYGHEPTMAWDQAATAWAPRGDDRAWAALIAESPNAARKMAEKELGWVPFDRMRDIWLTPSKTIVVIVSDVRRTHGMEIGRVAIIGSTAWFQKQIGGLGRMEVVEIRDL